MSSHDDVDAVQMTFTWSRDKRQETDELDWPEPDELEWGETDELDWPEPDELEWEETDELD